MTAVSTKSRLSQAEDPLLRLRADALPNLLDGWVGRVVLDGETEVVLLPERPLRVWLPGPHRCLEGEEVVRVKKRDLSLSAHRSECRDQILRAIAWTVGLELRSSAPDWGPSYAWEVYGWTVGDDHSPRSVMFMPPETIERRPNWIGNRRIAIPGLPDPRTYGNPMVRHDFLLDGSERLFARALVHVAEHLGKMERR